MGLLNEAFIISPLSSCTLCSDMRAVLPIGALTSQISPFWNQLWLPVSAYVLLLFSLGLSRAWVLARHIPYGSANTSLSSMASRWI